MTQRDRTVAPRLHDWCWPYGDVQHDPWPGDLAFVYERLWYRFDGRHWRWLP